MTTNNKEITKNLSVEIQEIIAELIPTATDNLQKETLATKLSQQLLQKWPGTSSYLSIPYL